MKTPPRSGQMLTIRVDHATHEAVKVLAHEERLSIQKLVAGWILKAITGNQAASNVLKLQRAIEKKGEGI